METIALMGAGGKIGCRIADRLRNTSYRMHYVEVSEAGQENLRKTRPRDNRAGPGAP